MCVCVCTCVLASISEQCSTQQTQQCLPQLLSTEGSTPTYSTTYHSRPLLNYNLSHRAASQTLLGHCPFIPTFTLTNHSSSLSPYPFSLNTSLPQEFHTVVVHSSPLHRLYNYPLLCVFAAPSPYLLIAIIAQHQQHKGGGWRGETTLNASHLLSFYSLHSLEESCLYFTQGPCLINLPIYTRTHNE